MRTGLKHTVRINTVMNIKLERTFKERHKIMPYWAKILITSLSATIAGLCVYIYYLHIVGVVATTPSNLSLATIFMFASGVIAVVWTPWDKLGLRVKKVGLFEFEHIVEAQRKDHHEDINHLYKRIRMIEKALSDGQVSEEEALRPMIYDLLTKYAGYKFSSVRILRWGSKQSGFEEIGNHDITVIRCALHELVNEDWVTTTVGETGATLYQVRSK